jgi:hypothetical protein
VGLKDELVEVALGGEADRQRFGSRNTPPYFAIAFVIAAALAVGILVVMFRCKAASEDKEKAGALDDETTASKLVEELRTKLATTRTLASIPDASCPEDVTSVPLVQQAWLVHAILDHGSSEPPVQSTPFVWIVQGDELPAAQRKNRNRRLREILDGKYLAISIAAKAQAVHPAEAGHFEGQIQIVELATVKPVCAITIVFDVYKKTSQSDDQAWTTPFWSAADAALKKAAPRAKFRLD